MIQYMHTSLNMYGFKLIYKVKSLEVLFVGVSWDS